MRGREVWKQIPSKEEYVTEMNDPVTNGYIDDLTRKKRDEDRGYVNEAEDNLYTYKWKYGNFTITVEGVVTLVLVQLPGLVLGMLGVIKAFLMYGRSREACLKALR